MGPVMAMVRQGVNDLTKQMMKCEEQLEAMSGAGDVRTWPGGALNDVWSLEVSRASYISNIYI